jgi:hypothetical protein
LAVDTNSDYAQIRQNPNQSIKSGNPIKIMWEDWGVKNNIIGDFIFNIGYRMCKENVAIELCNKFNTLKTFDVKWTLNPKEINAKNKSRLKWLPKEDVNIKIIYTNTEIPISEKSSVKYEISDRKKYIPYKSLEGISKLQGDIIIPRERDKGFYFNKNDTKGLDVFSPEDTGYIFCTEKVKNFVKKKNIQI